MKKAISKPDLIEKNLPHEFMTRYETLKAEK